MDLKANTPAASVIDMIAIPVKMFIGSCEKEYEFITINDSISPVKIPIKVTSV